MKTGMICLFAFLIAAIQVPAFAQEDPTLIGTIVAELDDNDRIESAELEVYTLDEAEYFSIQLDDRSRSWVKRFEDMEVEVTVEAMPAKAKDGEQRCLKLTSCLLSLTGQFEVMKDEETGKETLCLVTRWDETFEVEKDKTALAMAKKFKNSYVRAACEILKSNAGEDRIVIKRCKEQLTAAGQLVVEEDDEGNVTEIKFCVNDKAGKTTRTLYLPLDAIGHRLVKDFAEETVEVTGLVTEKGGRSWIHVLNCEVAEEDDEEEIDEDLDEGDGI